MNKKRLLKLADLLEADAKNRKGIKFDLGALGASTDDRRFVAGERLPSVSCGTAACAMGLAAISGAFKRQGLGYRIDPTFGDIDCTIHGQRRYYDGAASELFKITEEEAQFLFSPDYYNGHPTTGARGERFVAKRIRDFVAGKVST